MSQTALRTVQTALPHVPARGKRKMRRRVTVSLRQQRPSPEAARQKRALGDLQRRLARLPVRNAADGFSGRDHDKVLYGRE